MWWDHDERAHGDMIDLIDEPDYQDGFFWNCCDRRGDEDGCVKERHVPKRDTRRKRV